ncbi:ras-related and estrogen-regulated growth inhibitor [Condylostylus longicornis]|uniref:ras-related and estrogen-regulated growth inhibitor n=1 Tax=Condylostylus longicornis TaxID=2530218 RepID=UPI00244E1C33|nr:ras-related and estrogen-regulated growth inhibitor [Condylostylus longicornis]XP_055384068.1 ras-related and estrogen-regulated growth inhibitor [Condylostylus longicornis]XP_055384069.1 ras-related and estrogen-regulated growth inhibitor [Condylostylus longicornis]
MTTRGIRRKKSSLSEVKIAVVGAPGVGKSALIVRFISKRYIGEYDHQGESRAKHEAMIDNEPVMFEILDTCPKDKDDFPNASDLIQWADGLLLVYSITDRHSFNYIRKVKSDFSSDLPVVLCANKVDMVHLRQVSTEEGEILAKDFECKFSEVSAAEHVGQVAEVFHDLCKDILSSKRKSKQSILERVERILGGGTKPYSRGKSDSALPKD